MTDELLDEELGDGSTPRPGRRSKASQRSDETWPSLVIAARQTGLSISTLRRMVKEGAVSSKVVNGTIRVCPDELAEVGDNSVNPTQLVSAAHAHVQSLIRLVTEPNAKLLQLLIDENEHLRSRCGELEEAHLKVLAAHEEAMSLATERQIALKKFERNEARLDEGMKQIFEIAPEVFKQAIGRTTVQKVIDSLSDEQIQMLREIEAIDDKQVELLRQVRAKSKQKEEKRTNGAGDTLGATNERSDN